MVNWKRALVLDLIVAAVILSAVAAFAQTKSKSLYKLFHFSSTEIGIACQDGTVPFVTDAPRGTAVLIISCREH